MGMGCHTGINSMGMGAGAGGGAIGNSLTASASFGGGITSDSPFNAATVTMAAAQQWAQPLLHNTSAAVAASEQQPGRPIVM
jgi:hypothetical protein